VILCSECWELMYAMMHGINVMLNIYICNSLKFWSLCGTVPKKQKCSKSHDTIMDDNMEE
jgi:hypothetical protein